MDALNSRDYATRPSGTHIQAMLYYPYGSTWQDTTGAIWDERFAGMMVADADFQQYMTPARMYSPALGRWMTPDPAGLAAIDPSNPDTFNRYSYALNKPASMIDPSGLVGAAVGVDLVEQFQFLPCVTGAICMNVTTPGPPDPNILPGLDPRVELALDALQAVEPGTASHFTIHISSVSRPPWYHNSCVTSALGKGALSVGVGSIGLIPEAGGIARIIGHQAGYVGVVADQSGANILNAVGHTGATVQGFSGLFDTSPTGLLSTGRVAQTLIFDVCDQRS